MADTGRLRSRHPRLREALLRLAEVVHLLWVVGWVLLRLVVLLLWDLLKAAVRLLVVAPLRWVEVLPLRVGALLKALLRIP